MSNSGEVSLILSMAGLDPAIQSLAKRRVARALPCAVCRPPETGDERRTRAHAFAAIFAHGSHFGSAFIGPPNCLAAPGS